MIDLEPSWPRRSRKSSACIRESNNIRMPAVAAIARFPQFVAKGVSFIISLPRCFDNADRSSAHPQIQRVHEGDSVLPNSSKRYRKITVPDDTYRSASFSNAAMSLAESVFGAAITAFSPLKLVSQNSTAEKRLSFASSIFKRSALLGGNVTTETKWVLRRIAAIFSTVGRRDRYEYKATVFGKSCFVQSIFGSSA